MGSIYRPHFSDNDTHMMRPNLHKYDCFREFDGYYWMLQLPGSSAAFTFKCWEGAKNFAVKFEKSRKAASALRLDISNEIEGVPI